MVSKILGISRSIDFEFDIKRILVLSTLLGYFFIHLYWYWPGLLSYDGLFYHEAFNRTSCFQASWESYFYSCLYYLLTQSPLYIGLYCIFQILVAIVCLDSIYLFLSQRVKLGWLAVFWTLLIGLLPGHSHLLLLTERDTLFAWVSLYGVVQFLELNLELSQNKASPRSLKVFVFALTLILASLIRKEGLALALICFLQMGFRYRQYFFKKMRLVLVGILASIIIFHILVPNYFNASIKNIEFNHSSNIPWVFGPLQNIFSKRHVELTLDEKAAFEKVVLIDVIKIFSKTSNNRDHSFVNFSVDANERAQFFSVALKVIFMNLDLFFEERWREFKSVRHTYVFEDVTMSQDPSVREQVERQGVALLATQRFATKSSIIWRQYLWIMEKLYLELVGFIGLVYAAILLTSIFSAHSRSFLSLFVAPYAIFAIVFLFQPIAKARYWYFVYLAGVVMFIFFIYSKRWLAPVKVADETVGPAS